MARKKHVFQVCYTYLEKGKTKKNKYTKSLTTLGLYRELLDLERTHIRCDSLAYLGNLAVTLSQDRQRLFWYVSAKVCRDLEIGKGDGGLFIAESPFNYSAIS